MSFPRVSYRVKVVVRILLIVSVGLAGIMIATETSYWLVACWLGILDIALIVELIRLHERSRKVLRDFLHSIRQEDYSSLSVISEADRELEEAYRFILDQFRFLRIEKEAHYHYLQRVIEHVDAALICLDHDQNVHLINDSTLGLLQIPKIHDLKPLEKIDKDLFQTIRKIQTGQREMVRLIRGGKMMNLLVRATEFTLEKKTYKIVSLQDIESELEKQEVDAWQKLVRVLTHEIMNSTIPITNMVAFAREFLVDGEGEPKKIPGLDREEIKDLMESLATAESRGKGLINFVNTTKSLTRIPEPSFRVIKIHDLFTRLKGLFGRELESSGIQLKIILKQAELIINADLELIEQVLINLMRNAIEALAGIPDPAIELSAGRNRTGHVVISVTDNGTGIDRENLDQIFVPFYTTRKKGSGIGLSLSRQIMSLHRGRIKVESEKGSGSRFSLEF